MKSGGKIMMRSAHLGAEAALGMPISEAHRLNQAHVRPKQERPRSASLVPNPDGNRLERRRYAAMLRKSGK
jgi:hypothetical protein